MAGNIPIFVPHSGCPNQCSFCNQHTISGSASAPTPSEAAELCSSALATIPADKRVEIAFFGGSFTAIPRQEMISLLKAVQPFLSDPRVSGIRLSTRPDAVGEDVLETLLSYGVTAVELGAQSMDDRVLAMNRRGHTAAQVCDAAERVAKAGFSLGLQMMTGLYGADAQSDYETGLRLAELCPDTVRIYPTVVLAGTELARLLADGEYQPPGVEESLTLLVSLTELFESRGIKIIRLGLHSSETMETQIVGGCYHPSLGELVLGRRFLAEILAEAERLGGDSFTLAVAPKKASQVLGQHRANLALLRQKGYNISYYIDRDLADATFVLRKKG